MKKFLFIFLAIYFNFLTLAQSVVIPSEFVNDSEWNNFFDHHSHFISYKEFINQKTTKSSTLQQIIAIFTNAKNAFINGKHQQAYDLFFEITQKQHLEDWPEAYRKLITHSFLRCAQLSQSNIKKKYFIEKAILFSQKSSIEDSLYPPDIRHLYLSSLKSFKRIYFSKQKWQKLEARVNGLTVNLQTPYYVGEVRLSFWGNKQLYSSKIMNLTNINTLKIQPIKALGNCSQPDINYHKSKDLASLLFLYPNNCLTLNKNNFDIVKNYNSQMNSQKPKKSWVERHKWKIFITSLLTGAVIYNQYNNKKDKPSSKTTIKFDF